MDDITQNQVKPDEINVSRKALSVARILDREAAASTLSVVIITVMPDSTWRVEISQQKRVVELTKQK